MLNDIEIEEIVTEHMKSLARDPTENAKKSFCRSAIKTALALQAKSHAAVAKMVERPDLEALTCTATREPEFGNRLKAALTITDYADKLRTALTHATLAKEAADKEVGRLVNEKEVRDAERIQKWGASVAVQQERAEAAEQRAAAMELRLRAIITQAHNLPASETAVKIVAIAAQSGGGGG